MADGDEKKVMVDETREEPWKYEVENLKIALKAANNALKVLAKFWICLTHVFLLPPHWLTRCVMVQI